MSYNKNLVEGTSTSRENILENFPIGGNYIENTPMLSVYSYIPKQFWRTTAMDTIHEWERHCSYGIPIYQYSDMPIMSYTSYKRIYNDEPAVYNLDTFKNGMILKGMLVDFGFNFRIIEKPPHHPKISEFDLDYRNSVRLMNLNLRTAPYSIHDDIFNKPFNNVVEYTKNGLRFTYGNVFNLLVHKENMNRLLTQKFSDIAPQIREYILELDEISQQRRDFDSLADECAAVSARFLDDISPSHHLLAYPFIPNEFLFDKKWYTFHASVEPSNIGFLHVRDGSFIFDLEERKMRQVINNDPFDEFSVSQNQSLGRELPHFGPSKRAENALRMFTKKGEEWNANRFIGRALIYQNLNDMEVNEVLQLFRIVTPTLSNKSDALFRFDATVNKLKNKIYFPKEQKFNNFEEAWEAALQDHYYKNPHHPEYFNSLDHESVSNIKATYETMIDLLVSAARVESVKNWHEAYNMIKTWLYKDVEGYFEVNDKFKKLNPLGILLFLVTIKTKTLADVDLSPLKRNFARRREVDDSSKFDWLNALNTTDRKIQNKIIFKTKKIQQYLQETAAHVNVINEELMRMRIKATHDNDKFEYQKIIIYTWQFFIKETQFGQTAKYARKPKIVEGTSLTSMLGGAKTSFSNYLSKMGKSINPFSSTIDKVEGFIESMEGTIQTIIEKIKEMLSNAFTVTQKCFIEAINVIELIFAYLIYINTQSIVLKIAVVTWTLNKLDLLDNFIAAAKYVMAGVNEGITWTSGEDEEESFWDKLLSMFTDQSPVVMASIATIIIGTFVGVSVIKKNKIPTTIADKITECMKNFHFIGAGFAGFGKIFTYIFSTLKVCMEWIAEHVLKRKTATMKTQDAEVAFRNRVATWAANVDINSTTEGITLIRTDSDYAEKAELIIKESFVLYLMAIKNQVPNDMKATIHQQHKKCLELHNVLQRTKAATSFRNTPFHIQFFGAPGIGKSTLHKRIVKDLHEKYYSSRPLNTLVYSPNQDKDHWDGYNQQPIILVDEMWKILDAETLTEYLTIISCAPLMLPMAWLSEKVQYFTSEFIISNTNVPYPNAQGIASMEAVHRRRHLFVEVTINSKVLNKATMKFDMALFRTQYPGKQASDFPHLRFHLMKPVQNGESDKYEQGDTLPCGFVFPTTDLTYADMMKQMYRRREALRAEENSVLSGAISDEVIDGFHADLEDLLDELNNPELTKTRDWVTENFTVPPNYTPEMYHPEASEAIKDIVADLRKSLDDMKNMSVDDILDKDFGPPMKVLRNDYVEMRSIKFDDELTGVIYSLDKDFLAGIKASANITPAIPPFAEIMVLCKDRKWARYYYSKMEYKGRVRNYLKTIRDTGSAITDEEIEENILNEVILPYEECVWGPREELIFDIIDTKKSFTSYEDADRHCRPCMYTNQVDLNGNCSPNSGNPFVCDECQRNKDIMEAVRSYNISLKNKRPEQARRFKRIIEKLVKDQYQNMPSDASKADMNSIFGKEFFTKTFRTTEQTQIYKDFELKHGELTDIYKLQFQIPEKPARVFKTIYLDGKTEDLNMGDYNIPLDWMSPFVLTSGDKKKDLWKNSMFTDLENTGIIAHFLDNVKKEDGKWYYQLNPTTLVLYRYYCLKNANEIIGCNFMNPLMAWKPFRESLYNFMILLNEEQREYLVQENNWRTKLRNTFLNLKNSLASKLSMYYEKLCTIFKPTLSTVWNFLKKHQWKILSVLCCVAFVTFVREMGSLFSGPQFTSTMPLKMRAVSSIPRVLQRTSCSPEELDTKRRITERTVYSIRVLQESGNFANSQMIGIESHLFMINTHQLTDADKNLDCVRIEIQPSLNSPEYWPYNVPINNFYSIPDSDITFVRIDEMAPCKSSKKFFWKRADFEHHILDNPALLYKLDSRCYISTVDSLQLVDNVTLDDKGTVYHCDKVLFYKNIPPKGSSGAPMFLSNKHTGCRTMIGMQSWRDGNGGYACVVTQETIDDAIKVLGTGIAIREPDSVLEFTNSHEQIGRSEKYLTSHVIVDSVAPPEKQMPYVGKSIFEKTIISDMFTSDRIPAILNPTDVRVPRGVHPLSHSINKFGRDIMTPPPQHLINHTITQVTCYYANMTTFNVLGPVPFEATLIGNENGVNNKINTKTALGIPFAYNKKEPGKQTYLRFDEHGEIEFLDPIVKETFDYYDALIRTGVVPSHLCYEFAKDELRPEAKALGPPIKTRSVTVIDWIMNLLYRKYNMNFDSVLASKADGTQSFCVGINAESLSWTRMYYKLLSRNTRGYDLDVSNWDGHYPAWLMQAVTTIRNNVCGGNNADKLARKTLCEFVLFPYIMFGDTIYQKLRGMPSGWAGTASDNTLGHIALMFLLFSEICEERFNILPTYDQYEQLVSAYFYGDDVQLAVCPTIEKWFNGVTIAEKYEKYGWPVTSGHKDGQLSKSIPIEQMTFLKRVAKPHPTYGRSIMLGALDKSVIEDMCYWIRTTENKREQLYINLRLALSYAIPHGKSYFNDLLGRIQEGLRHKGLRLLQDDWNTILSEYNKRLFES